MYLRSFREAPLHHWTAVNDVEVPQSNYEYSYTATLHSSTSMCSLQMVYAVLLSASTRWATKAGSIVKRPQLGRQLLVRFGFAKFESKHRSTRLFSSEEPR